MPGVIASLPPLVEQPPGQSSSNPAGLPGATYTVAVLNLPQTWSALQTFTGGIGLGAATATSINKYTFTAPATAATLTILDGKTATFNNSITFAGTDATTLTFQGTDTYVGRATIDTLTNKTFDTGGVGNALSIAGMAVTANTGTGAIARAVSPAFTTPNVGAATGSSLVAGAIDLIPSVTNKIEASSSTAISGLALGQSTANHLEVLWQYNATATSSYAQIATYGYANPINMDASLLTLQGASGGAIRVGHTIAALGTRLDVRDTTTLSNNTAVYLETQRNVASVSNDNITTVNNVSTTSVDAGTGRFVMRNLGTANGYVASTKGAFVRALEAHTLVDSSIPNDATRTTWIMELGLHSQLAGDGISKNSGIYLSSSHSGWLPTGVRNDTALLVTGEDGWTNAIRYLDTNGTTVLFNVDQTGYATAQGVSTVNLTASGILTLSGQTSPATLTASVNDYAVSQYLILRLSSSATWNITGLSAAQSTGQVKKLINVGTFPIVLTNEDVLSLAANRFHIGANYVLRPGMSLDLWYDGTLARWTANIGAQLGTTLADSAQPGTIGELVSSTVAIASPVALVSGTTKDITSISLTPGDWDVWWEALCIPAATTNSTRIYASINTTANALNYTAGNFTEAPIPSSGFVGNSIGLTVGPVQFSLAATTTIFGNLTDTFTVSTASGAGVLRARRVR